MSLTETQGRVELKLRDLLTVCVIARNEETWLPDCLASVRSLGASLVVADGGSLDRTAEIARSFTDRVVSFAWNDDFSAARNRALEAADTPWVLTLDADERLFSTEPVTLASILRNLDLDGVSVPILFFDGPNLLQLMRRPRLFRRTGARYRGRVAETLDLPGSRWSFIPRPDLLEIHNFGHFGQAFESRRDASHKMSILDKELEQTTDTIQRHRLIFQAGGEWFRSGNFPQAAACFRAVAQSSPEKDPLLAVQARLGLLDALLGMERFGDALELAEAIVSSHGELKVAWGQKAYALNRLERSAEAAVAIRQGITAKSHLTWLGADSANIAQELWYDLGVTLQRLGNLTGAMYACLKLKAEAPGWHGPLSNDRRAFRLLVEAGDVEEAKLLLREITANNPAARTTLLEDLSQLGQPELALEILLASAESPLEVTN